MKIVNIKIQNFKSIQTTNVDLSDFNVNVGQNNHGKSNFFEAIRWFFGGFNKGEGLKNIQCVSSDTTEPVIVEITFNGFQEKLDKSESPKVKTLIAMLGDSDTIVIRRSSNSDEGKKRELLNPKTKLWENPIGTDNAWGEFLPIFEYVKTQLSLEDIDTYKTTSPIGHMLTGLLQVIIEKDPEYAKFREQFDKLFKDDSSQVRIELNKLGGEVSVFLQKQFPDGTTVKFNVENPQFDELLKNFQTVVNDGVETTAAEKGDGMQRAIMLAIIQTYADYRRKESLSNNFIFLIDEAELHLHPSGQRALKTALLDITLQGDQVLINTHSSVLVAEGHDKQTILVTKKTNGITDINPINDSEKPSVIFDLLGGSPTDLLLPSNILIVEGYSEVKFLRNIVQRFYPSLYSSIQIVPANGDVTKQDKSIKFIDLAYECFKSSANPYSTKVIVVADGFNTSNKDDYEKFKVTHQEIVNSGRFFELPVDSLEQYYPESYKADPCSIGGQKGGKNLYAETISNKITKDQFEKDMLVFFEAIKKADSLSFGKSKN